MALRMIICVLALLLFLVPQTTAAQCPGGQCPVRASAAVAVGPRVALRLPGRPVARTAKATAVVMRGAAKVAAAPVRVAAKATTKMFQRQPVRRVLRAAAKVVTGQGPLMQRFRGRSCR